MDHTVNVDKKVVRELQMTLGQHVQRGAALAEKLDFAGGSAAAVGDERAREVEEEEEALPGERKRRFDQPLSLKRP